MFLYSCNSYKTGCQKLKHKKALISCLKKLGKLVLELNKILCQSSYKNIY